MVSVRFDTMTRRVAAGTSRRGLLGVALGVLFGLVGASESSAGHHHHHHHKRCKKQGRSCSVNKQGTCCSKTCGTQGNAVGKCCIPSGKPCTSAGDCCNGNFGCTGTARGSVCS